MSTNADARAEADADANANADAGAGPDGDSAAARTNADAGAPAAGARDVAPAPGPAHAPVPGPDDADGRSPAALAAVLAAALAPWSVQTFARPGSGLSFVFPWGLFNTAPPRVTTLPDFLFVYTAGLPDYILAWPVSTLLWGVAVVGAAVGYATGREDPRVTALALVLAGVAQVSLAAGFSVQPSRTAYPLGTLLLWTVAWWFYWPAVRATLLGRRS